MLAGRGRSMQRWRPSCNSDFQSVAKLDHVFDTLDSLSNTLSSATMLKRLRLDFSGLQSRFAGSEGASQPVMPGLYTDS